MRKRAEWLASWWTRCKLKRRKCYYWVLNKLIYEETICRWVLLEEIIREERYNLWLCHTKDSMDWWWVGRNKRHSLVKLILKGFQVAQIKYKSILSSWSTILIQILHQLRINTTTSYVKLSPGLKSNSQCSL